MALRNALACHRTQAARRKARDVLTSTFVSAGSNRGHQRRGDAEIHVRRGEADEGVTTGLASMYSACSLLLPSLVLLVLFISVDV